MPLGTRWEEAADPGLGFPQQISTRQAPAWLSYPRGRLRKPFPLDMP